MSESEIFTAAMKLPGDQRADFLNKSCGDDSALRQAVEGLLIAHDASVAFLAQPHVCYEVTQHGEHVAEGAGFKIGAYKLLQKIGEGGMGVVYMAEQEEPVRRRVALKIIKPGMDSRAVIARFEAERQALAMMDHQNIARVLDAGTTDSGRPFFVMELVHGVPVTRFCDDNRLSLRQRLELFVPICQAIQHAHQKGIIHRDIKPGNILVTMYDDKPVPKVIDFGVAKAVEQRLTEKTLFTQYGALVGTFEYMSPEQAEMNALGVDTRSDVYSLGVLLYELLTGTTPLERQRLRETALQEMLRIIREEEPPRPSVRLSSSGELPKVAAACGVDPARLPQLLRGELDWIVMKCIEKDRTRRYETANGLARDVQRYLTDEPVEACPPSLSYRLSKFAQKHRGLIATAASFVGLMMLGIVATTWLAAWALKSQRAAQVARADAEAALGSERQARHDAETARAEAVGFSRRLRQATQLANSGIDALNRQSWAQAYALFNRADALQPDLWMTYTHRARLFTSVGLWDKAVADYDRCRLLAPKATTQSLYEHAVLKLAAQDSAGYRQICQEIHDRFSGWGGDHLFGVLRACTLAPEAGLDAVLLARRGEDLITHKYVPWYLGTAGLAHLRAGNLDQAADRLKEALKAGVDSPKGVHRYYCILLAMVLHRQGRTAEAQAMLEEGSQAIQQWTKEMVGDSIGTTPISWHDWLCARILHDEATRLITGTSPVKDPLVNVLRERALAAVEQGDAATFMSEGDTHLRNKDWDQAAVAYSHVLDNLPMGYRASSREQWFCVEMVSYPEVFDRLVKLRPQDQRLWAARARLFATHRDWSRSASDFYQALQCIQENTSKAGVADIVGPQRGRSSLLYHLAAVRLLAGDEGGYRQICTQIAETSQDFTDHVAWSILSRTTTLSPAALQDWTSAIRLAQQTVDFQSENAWYLYGLGAAHYRAGNYDAVIQNLEKSLKVYPTWLGRGQNYVLLAMACHQLGREAEARDWLAKTRTWLDETNRDIDGTKHGYAASDYLSDWLAVLILVDEAERLIAAN